jgi:membrane protein DedA with SNARE-associated domain
VTITLMVGAGYLGGNSLQALRRDLSRVEHIAVVVATAALAAFLVYRYFKARRGDKDEA